MMDVRQAGAELRKLLNTFRALEHIEEVLDAAADAEAAQAALGRRVEALGAEGEQLKEQVALGRRMFTEEQTAAAVEMEHLSEVHRAAEKKFAAEASASKEARERAAGEQITASELLVKRLKAECSALEGNREQLESELERARVEYDAMLERLGVKHG